MKELSELSPEDRQELMILNEQLGDESLDEKIRTEKLRRRRVLMGMPVADSYSVDVLARESADTKALVEEHKGLIAEIRLALTAVNEKLDVFQSEIARLQGSKPVKKTTKKVKKAEEKEPVKEVKRLDDKEPPTAPHLRDVF